MEILPVDRKDREAVCPACKTDGVQVPYLTVRHLVKDEFFQANHTVQFHICMNPTCDVVYFGSDDQMIFIQDQVKVPVWFKDGATPKYACYCSEVTVEQVIEAVRLGSVTLGEVVIATKAMKNSRCLEKNPLGVCCHAIIEEAMRKAKSTSS